jgi:hypothetical protein
MDTENASLISVYQAVDRGYDALTFFIQTVLQASAFLVTGDVGTYV